MRREDKKETPTPPLITKTDYTDVLITEGGTLDKVTGERQPVPIVVPEPEEAVQFNRNTSEINEDILNMFPDLLTGMNVIKATVLNAEPSFKLPSFLPPTMVIDLLESVEETINNKHELSGEVSEILEQTHFYTGSAAYLTIPWKQLKQTIGSTINAPKTGNEIDENVDAYLDATTGMFEDMSEYKALGFSITENVDAIRMQDKIEERKLKIAYESSNEIAELTDSDFNFIDNPKIEDVVSMIENPDFGDSDGIHLKVNSNYIIPLIINGSKKKPIGYIFLANENGRVIQEEDGDYLSLGLDYATENGSTDELREMIDKYKKQTSSTVVAPQLELGDQTAYYALVDQHIKQAINKSSIGELARPDISNEVLSIMFQRALQAKQTRLIYLNSDMVTYYAFNHRKNGTGKSILEDLRHLISVRAMLTFAKIRSEVENSISKRVIDIKLDPVDKNPEATMAKFINEYNKAFNKSFNWSSTSITETSEWVQQVGISYRFEHPKVPYNEINEGSQQVGTGTSIDQSMIDDVKKDIFRRMGLTQQMVDDAATSDFASISILSNELSRNEMSEIQTKLMAQYSKHVQKILLIDREFRITLYIAVEKNRALLIRTFGKQLKDKIDEGNWSEEQTNKWLVGYIIRNITTTLPTLRSENESDLFERFKVYRDLLDETLESILLTNESMPREFVGEEMQGVLDVFVDSYKHMLLRNWMRDNNFMPEIYDVINIKDGIVSIEHLNEYTSMLQKLGVALNPIAKSFTKVRKKLNKVGTKIIEGVEEPVVVEEPVKETQPVIEEPIVEDTTKIEESIVEDPKKLEEPIVVEEELEPNGEEKPFNIKDIDSLINKP